MVKFLLKQDPCQSQISSISSIYTRPINLKKKEQKRNLISYLNKLRYTLNILENAQNNQILRSNIEFIIFSCDSVVSASITVIFDDIQELVIAIRSFEKLLKSRFIETCHSRSTSK